MQCIVENYYVMYLFHLFLEDFHNLLFIYKPLDDIMFVFHSKFSFKVSEDTTLIKSNLSHKKKCFKHFYMRSKSSLLLHISLKNQKKLQFKILFFKCKSSCPKDTFNVALGS